MTESQHDQVMQLLRAEYDALDKSGEITVRPALVAALTMKKMDAEQHTPILVAYVAILQMRQMAREICRQVSEREDPSQQEALFDGQLQRRYPSTRNGDEGYTLRECLTLTERRENSARLQREGEAKIRHARALDAETDALLAAGRLHKDDGKAA